MKKIKKIFLSLIGIALNSFFIKETQAQSAMYGVNMLPRAEYGIEIPPSTPSDWEWWHRWISVLFFPVLILLILGMGIFAFIQRRKGKKIKKIIIRGAILIVALIAAYYLAQFVTAILG